MSLKTIADRAAAWLRWVPAPDLPRAGRPVVALAVGRGLLLNAALVYSVWWLLVEALLPGSYNPASTRFSIVATLLALFAATYLHRWTMQHAHLLFVAGAWLLTLHYFSLILGNRGSPDWVVGSYFAVVAINACLQTRASLIGYNAFVVALALGALAVLPDLRESIFLAGLITIGPLSYVGLHFRLKLVDQLARSSDRFQNLFHAVFEGIFLHSHGTIVDANDSVAALFGRTREELIGTDLMSHWDEACRSALPDPAKWPIDEPFGLIGLCKDGSRIHLEASVKVLTFQGQTLGLIALRDVSDRRRIEEERIRFIRAEAGRAAAEEVVRRQEEFISIAAHELRTPMTSLQLNVQQLSRLAAEAGAAQIAKSELKPPLESCQRQARRLTRLTTDLVELSRVGMRRIELDLEWLDARGLINEVVEGLRDEARNAACRIDVTLNADLQLRGDRLRLEQVLGNLLRNAYIYGSGHPIGLTVTGTHERLQLKVTDRGIGIDPEDQTRIFERFERAVSPSHYGGLGLGLYIAKQIVSAHGGEITVSSAPGRGSTFTVDLPRDPAFSRRSAVPSNP